MKPQQPVAPLARRQVLIPARPLGFGR